MADIRAQALANTFLLPQRAPVQAPQITSTGSVPAPPSQSAVPDPIEGLQYVENTTKDYYDKWANLKSFVNSAWTNFGIDVTKPDFTRPESIKMNEIYNKAVADIRFQGDQLKTSQQELSRIMSDQRQGRVLMQGDPSQAPITQTPSQDLYTPTAVDPLVSQTNEFSKRRFFTSQEYTQAMKGFEETKAYLQGQASADPQNADYWNRQLELLQPPTKSTKIFAPPRDTDRGKGTSAGASLLKKVSNLMLGSGEAWSPASRIDPLKLQNNEFRGDQYGEFVTDEGKKISKVIDTFLYDPETRQVSIKYQDPRIPDDFVSDRDALTVARQLVSSNPKLGTLTSLDKYIEENTLLDAEGELDPSKLVSPRMASFQEQNLKQVQEIKPKYNKVKSQLSSQLDDLGRGLWGGTATFEIPSEFGGGELRIQRGLRSKKFFIDNYKDIWPDAKSKDFEKLSKDQVLNLLINLGVVENLINTLPEEQTTEQQFDPDI